MHDADAEHPLTLQAGDTVATIHPHEGGRLGRITVGDTDVLVDVPEPAERDPLAWGLYPMAPWAGRIREGRFDFGGTRHQLARNHRDGDDGDPRRHHSIHGTVWRRPWDVVEHTDRTARLRTPIGDGLDWPFGGRAEQRIELHRDRLVLTLAVDTDGAAFPAEIGWHPWFRRPDHLGFDPSRMYRRDEFGIPTGELVAPGEGPWDDCFLNTEPVRLHYDREHASTVTVTSDCDHWVVYDMPTDAICVEPQSGPPDAFNLVHHVVTPGSPLERTMTIAW